MAVVEYELVAELHTFTGVPPTDIVKVPAIKGQCTCSLFCKKLTVLPVGGTILFPLKVRVAEVYAAGLSSEMLTVQVKYVPVVGVAGMPVLSVICRSVQVTPYPLYSTILFNAFWNYVQLAL